MEFPIALKRIRPEVLLCTIGALCGETPKGVATNGDLARRLNASTGTISSLLKRLAEQGLVFHEPYEGVRLTPEGLRSSRRVIRRRLLLQQFLLETLSIPHVEATGEATELESVASDRLVIAVDHSLSHPQWTAEREPIPREDGSLPDFIRLVDCRVGAIVRVQSIEGPRLSIQGTEITTGVEVRVDQCDLESGTMTLIVGEKALTVGHTIAQRILVIDASVDRTELAAR